MARRMLARNVPTATRAMITSSELKAAARPPPNARMAMSQRAPITIRCGRLRADQRLRVSGRIFTGDLV